MRARCRRSMLLLALLACSAMAPRVSRAEDAAASAPTPSVSADLGAAKKSLGQAMDRARKTRFTMSAEDRGRRRDLLAEARRLHGEASAAGEGSDKAALVAKMDAVRDELDEFAARGDDSGAAAPQPYEKPPREMRRKGRHADGSAEASSAEGMAGPAAVEGPEPPAEKDLSPYVARRAFRDVAEDALSAQAGMTEDERVHARELIAQGEGVIGQLEKVSSHDHVARDEHLRELADLRDQLRDMQWAAQRNRTKGMPFVPARRTSTGWTQVDYAKDGLEALRVAFVEPGSARLTLRNATDEVRPLLVQMQFFDGTGEPTGDASWQSAALEELKPGEVREVLVLLHATHPRFWAVTRGYTVELE